MATYCTFECSSCDLEYRDNGPHPFYRDPAGTIVYLPHPSYGAKTHEIEGSTYNGFCLDCQEPRMFIQKAKQKSKDELEYLIMEVKNKPEPLECETCGGNHPYEIDANPYDRDVIRGLKKFKCPRCGEQSLEMVRCLVT